MSSSLPTSSTTPRPITSIPFYAQYRTPNTVVVLKEKCDGLSVTIHDLLNNGSIIKKKLPNEKVQLSNQSALKVIKDLIQRKLFSQTEIDLIQSGNNSLFSVKECLKEIESQLSKLKHNHMNNEEKESDICCPITQAPFIDPVIDDDGHTFEKAAIEEHLKRNNNCPISRQPITKLIPNRVLKESIETAKQKDPIPSLRVCKDEKPSIAKINIDLAKAHEEDGAYQEALNAYRKAFEYTKSHKDYRYIAPLFLKMEEPQKALVASLRLAQYQLEADDLEEALATLKNILRTHPQHSPTPLAILICTIFLEGERFITMYNATGNKNNESIHMNNSRLENIKKTRSVIEEIRDDIFDFSKRMALSNREKEILYRSIIQINPHCYNEYFSLASLISNPNEKKEIFLQGACHAIENKKYEDAQKLYNESTKIQGDDRLDTLVLISLLQYQGKHEELKKALQSIGEDLRKRSFFSMSVKIAKLLLGLEENPIHYRQIISDYKEMQSPKVYKWTQVFSNYLMAEKNLKVVDDPEDLMLIASALKSQNKIEGCVGVLYNAISFAFTQNRSELLLQCLKEIRELDPKLIFLKPDQRILLKIIQGHPSTPTQSRLIPTSSEKKEVESIASSRSKEIKNIPAQPILISSSSEKKEVESIASSRSNEIKNIPAQPNLISSSSEKKEVESIASSRSKEINNIPTQPNLNSSSSEKKEVASIASSESKEIEDKPVNAFGKDEWKKYIGDVEEEPPLPNEIHKILNDQCPFWKDKKVHQTHMLVLIPAKINGKPFTFRMLEELIKNPKLGKSVSFSGVFNYRSAFEEIRRQHGDEGPKKSYWMLITRDLLPKSKGLEWEKSEDLVRSYRFYTRPTLLEVTTALVTEYIKTGMPHFPAYRETRCSSRYTDYSGRWYGITVAYASGSDITVDYLRSCKSFSQVGSCGCRYL